MSIKLNVNGKILISNDDPAFAKVCDLLTIHDRELVIRKKYDRKLRRYKTEYTTNDVIRYLYDMGESHELMIGYGLYKYVKYLFKDSKVIYGGDKESKIVNTTDVVDNIEKYRNILQGISLYDNQLECLKKIFQYKRGVIQAGTGFGKTELMCATTQIMKEINDGKYPTVLILEPTVELVKGTIKRFKKYGIPVNNYRDTRCIFKNKINVGHPSSICNDLNTNKKLLDNVQVQFVDECHHSSATIYSTPTFNMPNLLYSIGLSATFLSHYHVDGDSIDEFSYEELRRIGIMGPLIMRVDAKDLIDNNQLAVPRLFVLHNPADEEMDERKVDYNWTNVRKMRLESPNRTKLIADCACIFAKYNYKVIIIMNTLDWGRSIMLEIAKNGYREKVRTCFGGQTYEKVNKSGKIEKDWNSALQLFDKDKINIIIGSSCLTEGVDLSKVDVCLGAFLGKGDRVTLQSVGRALRKSKTGNYSYIVDFNDCEDKMLTKQFNERMVKYKKVLGIDDNEMYVDINLAQVEGKFKKLEGLND